MTNILGKYNIRGLLVFAGLFFCTQLSAQGLFSKSAESYIREGNRHFNRGEYAKAEASYEKAIAMRKTANKPKFNMGAALYREDSLKDATKFWKQVANASENKQIKSDALYNIGNAYLKQKKLKQSINAYKQALINNPQHKMARYNLSYALKMLQKKKQQQQKQNKDQKQKKNQQKQQQQKKPQNKQQQKDRKEPQPTDRKLTKKEAERLLRAADNQEKKLRDKLKKQRGTVQPNAKNW